MRGYVLDASITMTWCFADEATAETWALFDRLRTERAVAPASWPVEVVNVLAMVQRSGRISAADAGAFLQVLLRVGIEVEPTPLDRAAREIRDLAAAERLTVHDAAYLELAMRRRLPLATKDNELRAAAMRHGVTVSP